MYQPNELRRENLRTFFDQYTVNEQTRGNMPYATNPMLLQGKRYGDSRQRYGHEEIREAPAQVYSQFPQVVEEQFVEQVVEEQVVEEQVVEEQVVEEQVEGTVEAGIEWDTTFQIMDQFHDEADFRAPLRIVYGFTDGILALNFA